MHGGGDDGVGLMMMVCRAGAKGTAHTFFSRKDAGQARKLIKARHARLCTCCVVYVVCGGAMPCTAWFWSAAVRLVTRIAAAGGEGRAFVHTWCPPVHDQSAMHHGGHPSDSAHLVK